MGTSGIAIERWGSTSEAQGRADYLVSVHQSMKVLGTEDDYVHGQAPVRLAGDVLPSDLALVEKELAVGRHRTHVRQ